MKNEEKQEEVERLREWLLLQPHLPKDVEDDFLLGYIYGCKSLEIAKQKLESLFTWRAHLRENVPFYNIRDPTDPYFQQSSKFGKVFFLPKDTPEGYKVLFIKNTDQFEEYYDHDQTTAHLHMTIEVSMARWPDVKGVVAVWDLEGFKPSYAAKMNLPSLETFVRYYQECYPILLKRLVYLNTPLLVETVYNSIFKPLLKDKIKKRITLTTEDGSCLKKFLPEDILPMDYGGKEKTSSELNEEWMNFLIEKKDWLKKNALLVADESKRPPNTKPSFGIEGTFRQLSID